MPVKKEIAPDRLAEARRLYEQTLAPVDDIAASLGIARPLFYRIAKREGWRGRRAKAGTFAFARALSGATLAVLAGEHPRAEIDVAAEPVTPAQRAALAQHMMRASEREIDAVERILAKVNPDGPVEAEQCARTVASVARTLREIAALNQPDEVTPADDTDDDPVPLDIDEFRLELARRIRGLIEARRDREIRSNGGAPAKLEPPGV
jgi:hypothetical protein